MIPFPTRTLFAICVLCGSNSQAQISSLPKTGVRGYVYVEPFEIRKEFVLPLKHLTATLKLPADGALDETARETLLENLGNQLSNACPILADGAPLTFKLDRIQFVTVDPQTGIAPEIRKIVPIRAATVAAVFALTREAPPTTLDITWDFFPDGDLEVPIGLEASTGTSMEFFNHVLTFTPSNNRQSWDLPDIGTPPALLVISQPPKGSFLSNYNFGIAFFIAAALLFALSRRIPRERRRPAILGIAILALMGSLILRSNSSNAPLTDEQATTIVDQLLHNIYHAFAYRDESRIFDTLATSVSGDLLEDLYLDIRSGLELETGGGPRVKIHRVVLGECTPDLSASPGFHASAAWTASGNVSHWGHIHPRRNKYRGDLTIEPIEGAWKVTDVQILQEERK